MTALLLAGDPDPVRIVNPGGTSPFLLIGDHAGRAVPAAIDLGVSEADMARHISWDIGIAALGKRLAARLDATFVAQTYSRLVIDCNRAPDAEDAMPPMSDGTDIAGNRDLSAVDRDVRVAAIHTPYQEHIAALLDARATAGQPTILIALHSFTPRMRGFDRPWHVGILHSRGDTRFAAVMLGLLSAQHDLIVGDNEPYAMANIDYTIPRHAFARGLPYAEIEVRQDLIAEDAGQERWAERLDTLLRAAREASGRT